MPRTTIEGIVTRYEVSGSGPALLMFSPGGFDAALDTWETHGVYRRTRILAHLQERYTCITFDKRESGQSGGRVERVTWQDYAEQGRGLLDHLDIERAHLMGGCVGCSIATVFALANPDRTDRVVLYSPAGGVRYRLKQHSRFARHAAYAEEHGLRQVAELAQTSGAGFGEDPRVGPWSAVLRADPGFARSYIDQDPELYQMVVAGVARTLFDRDTVPGPEPEDLLAADIRALVVPGQDSSHATSAARYLQECIRGAEYWDVSVAEQTEQTAPARVIEFLSPL